ncbi:hypothetical protein AB0M28_38295 [Streptomyces sp. NPDC051940]|uniref:hypothetical protein n=1 Tax=Streptomyces sp. NPDC051940 TaxID=3155675 RepID=UPI00342C972E
METSPALATGFLPGDLMIEELEPRLEFSMPPCDSPVDCSVCYVWSDDPDFPVVIAEWGNCS